MAIYNFSNESMDAISPTTFSNEGILERKHLQNALKKQIEIIAPDCMVISEEFGDWTESQRRIDILAIDRSANIVVIELKRNETGEHMELQSLRYAAMVSTMTFKDCVDIFQRYISKNGLEIISQEKILEFLGWDEPQEEDFALDVKIILVSANFSKELTISVMWLNERNINIKCFKLTPYKNGNQILIDIQQIIPLPEAENYQIKIKQQTEERREARNSSKDYTQYIYDNAVYNKRKLVLAVIKKWIDTNKPANLHELVDKFPQSIHSGSLFVPLSEAIETYERQKIARNFLGEDEVIKFSDGTIYSISNQWGKGSITRFIENCKKLNILIQES